MRIGRTLDSWDIIHVRRPGGYIKPGLSVQWTGGPIAWYMPRHRRWKIRVRLRFTTRGSGGNLVWAPAFHAERTFRQ